ncbi:MAG: class A beta-lactamase-related serine hydrolase [Chitinophagaceae bacterium]|jgi:beta-lactamase class A|nr:class A beta-lactamase-related serine hydrolase [Chitinophagaceae bacterium]
MMKQLICFLLSLLSLQVCTAQLTDRKLQKKVDELLKGFNGEVGVYIKDLKTGKTVAINADTVFPTASIVKVPILIGIMDKINKGELSYHQPLIYKDSLLYAGVDILGSFKNNESVELSKVLMLMLTTSDNTASLWLQHIAGTGSRINELLDSLGFRSTRVNSRTPGREENRNVYGWGQTTPFEMAALLEKIYRKEIFNEKSCVQMMRMLGRNYWDEEGLSQIPPTIEVFSKNGAVNASRSEVMLVNAPHHPYVFCTITKNIKDQSWGSTNEAWVLTRKLSALLWNYYGEKK